MALFDDEHDDEDHTTWSKSIQGLAPHVLSKGYRKFIKGPKPYDGLDGYNYYPHSRYHKHTTEESGGFSYSGRAVSVETTTRGRKLDKIVAYTGSVALIVKNTKP